MRCGDSSNLFHSKEIKTLKYRNAFHYVAGGITAWISFPNPILGLTLALTFLIYEAMNDWRKIDHSYHDILEFLIALFVVATGLKIWEIVR